MATKKYALEPGGPKRLEIIWKGSFKDTTIILDEVTLGTIPNQKTLRTPQEYQLSDGSLLKVQLVQNLLGVELNVSRDGVALPGSASDPDTLAKNAWAIIFFIAGLNLFLFIIVLFTRSEFLINLGVGWYNLLFGGIFLSMGFLVKKLSKIALILSIVLFSLDTLVGIIGTIMMSSSAPTFSLIFRVLLIVPMIQGVKAIDELKKRSVSSTTP